MNSIDNLTLENANSEAIYNVYSYLANKLPQNEVAVGESFKDIVGMLDGQVDSGWTEDELKQLNILKNAVSRDTNLANSVLLEQTEPNVGNNASIFKKANGDISVVFRGTGSGEWIDNGEGLSGIKESNVYKSYDSAGNYSGSYTEEGYATQQQMEALNWFNSKASKYGWDESTNIVVTGHSKGGNKAQFITLSSDLVDACYSYDGQGFSPEALAYYEDKYGIDYERRRQKMLSFSADNDYVNVLGERLIPEDHIFYFDSPQGDETIMGYHFMESMLNEYGYFNPQCEQGNFSVYIQNTSEEIMAMDSEMRQYVTLGLMNMAQSFLGGDKTVNGDCVSGKDTALGIAFSLPDILGNLLASREGLLTLEEFIPTISAMVMPKVYDWFTDLGENHGVFAQAGAMVLTVAVIRIVTPIIKGFVLIDVVQDIGAKLMKIGKEIYARVSGFIGSTISAISNWVNKTFNTGYKYATANPNIKVNTVALREYATRLANVNRRLSNLDYRLDRLYYKVSLSDLITIVQANYIVGYSWKITRCINYLNNTASDFENVERTIASKL